MGIKKISETRCTCNSCGNIWHYGKKEERANVGRAFENVANAGSDTATGCLTLGCCGGLQTNKQNKLMDLNRCPKCNSKNIKKEKVVHEIEK